jgi:ribosomal protein S18 acetylase RimI-like enzyme
MIEVREAVVGDAEAIARIHVATWQFAYRGQMPDALLDSLSVERRLTWRTRHLSEMPPKAHTLVALEDGAVVGFCDVGASPEEGAGVQDGALYAIYVAPEAMGKGAGSALMAEGVRRLRAEGFTRATLWVLTTNANARRFYEHHGWAADGAAKTEMWGEFALDEVRYALELE